ncbi:MAG: 6-carboxytetrahydropterin synthase QueD [Eubacterium sp.]|nr:6-carboxytetrahydropterin synthase QueD [Eubacterium sp.]
MYYLKTEQTFDSAHFLKGYNGKCHNIHGHCWKVIAEIKGDRLSEETNERGMLVDFGDIKTELKELCERLDHCLICEKDSLKPATLAAFREEDFAVFEVDFRPTAENFAKYFYDELKKKGFAMHRVEVYETVNNCAAYEEA